MTGPDPAPSSTGSAAPPGAPARVFFALWPDQAVQAALFRHGQALHRAVGGKLTRADSVHLTLLFLGNVPETGLAALPRVADPVRFAPFSIKVDTVKCWHHNNIAWAGPSVLPAELTDLVAQLESGASAAGFAFDRRPYAAHVTLVRKARCRRLDAEPIAVDWPVREFVLVRSQLHPDGSQYSVIERWSAS